MIGLFKEFFKPLDLFRSNPVELDDYGKYRVSGGTLDGDGNYIEPKKYTAYVINAIVSPARNKQYQDIKVVEGSKDLEGSLDIITENEIFNIDSDNSTNSDRVLYQNKVYEIKETANWDYLGFNFWKSKAHLIIQKYQELLNNSEFSPTPPTDTPIYSILKTLVENEVLGGLINGSNDIFTTANNFVLGTTAIYLNGKRLVLNQEYIELNSQDSIQILASEIIPTSGDILTGDYKVKL